VFPYLSRGLTEPLAIQQARLQVSFYADDVVLFLRPNNLHLVTVRHLLDLFGHSDDIFCSIPQIQRFDYISCILWPSRFKIKIVLIYDIMNVL